VDVAGITPRERAAYSQLGLFHRIYESMALGMHPAILYPRRSRFAPTSYGGILLLPGATPAGANREKLRLSRPDPN
jgi:hypothetical protein